MELIKYQASKVLYYIRHNMRQLPPGKQHGNESIDPSLSCNNYSLIDRGSTFHKVNQYRKKLEKETFKYNRKNLVHAIEVIIQCPADCPSEQKEDFFKESYNYICSTLPIGEKCVFLATVHKDEKHYAPDGTLISKDHLHIMYVPAIPDKKHEGYEYRLCADQLTKKADLHRMHAGLQNHLDKAGIKATAYHKKTSGGKTIGLSVAALKELTKRTGIKLDHSLTLEELASIISANIVQGKKLEVLQNELQQKELALKQATERIKGLESKLEQLERPAFPVKNRASENVWGRESGWGASDPWNNTKEKEYENKW